MDTVYLIISHKKTNIFTEAKESSSVFELKCTVEGILKRVPEDQRLFYKGNQLLKDSETLKSYGITKNNAGPEDPTRLGLVLRLDGESFEQMRLEPFSSPTQ